MTSRTRIALLGAAVVAVVLLMGWCARTPVVSVPTVEAREGELTVEVSTNGKVEPIDKAEVRARLDGRVVEIPEPGTRMDKGGVLLEIDGGPVAAELASAQSQRLAAQDSLRAVRAALDRVRRRVATDRDLLERNAITPKSFEESEAELREALARVTFLEEDVPLRISSLDLQIEELSARKSASVVRAPFAGTVYKVEAKRGQLVRVGELVLRFADLEQLRVRTNIDQVDLGRVRVGQTVEVTSDAYPNRRWKARIAELIPNVVVKESRFVAEGLASVEPPTEGLVPGMTVDVGILVDEVPNALQIPAEAIFSDKDGSFVYRIDDGHVRQTRVKVGRSTVASIEIVEGLDANDRVVTGPAPDLQDGDRVEIRAEGDRYL